MPYENRPEQYEDEIDLRELWRTIVSQKLFIILFTSVVTIAAGVYAYTKNPTPIYSGDMMIEIGVVKSDNIGLAYLDNVHNLKNILEKKYDVTVAVPKSTNNLLVISSSSENKELIEKNILTSVDFIISRHQTKAKLYDKYIMTKQIGEIDINDSPINTPKKKLIVVVAFVTGLILAIFLVFFLQFMRDESDS